MDTEMDIIIDDFMDDLVFSREEEEKIEKNKEKQYYIGKGEYMLKQLREDKRNYEDNYFHFLSSILKDFNCLTEDKKSFLKETMCIQDTVKVVEKKVVVNQNKKNNKPKLNMGNMKYDDY